MTWTTRKLSAIAHLSLGKMLDQNKNRGEPRPYLANINVRWGSFDLANLREMRFEPHEGERYGLLDGDIVMCEGGEPGRCALWRNEVPGTMLQKALHRIRVREGVEPQFLFYSLFEQGRSQRLAYLFTGATIKHLPSEQLAKVEVRLPPLATQRRIASILGAYDDLIDVNRRRIAVLDEMARRLFEEWFVLGSAPIGPRGEGSEVELREMRVGEVMRFVRGRSYRSADLAEGFGLPFINLKCMLRDGGFRRDGVKRYIGEFKDEQVLRHGDIVIAVTDMTQDRRIVGQAARIPRSEEPLAVMSMDLVKVVPRKDLDEFFCYFWLRYSGFARTAAQHANGANVLHLSPGAMVGLPITVPPLDVQTAFCHVAKPLAEQAEILSMANEKLVASRDLLLPRLISGDLSVAPAERELEAVV